MVYRSSQNHIELYTCSTGTTRRNELGGWLRRVVAIRHRTCIYCLALRSAQEGGLNAFIGNSYVAGYRPTSPISITLVNSNAGREARCLAGLHYCGQLVSVEPSITTSRRLTACSGKTGTLPSMVNRKCEIR
jgi:hypothetical protein